MAAESRQPVMKVTELWSRNVPHTLPEKERESGGGEEGRRETPTLLHTRKMLSNCITSKNNKQIVKIRQLCSLQLQ